MSGYLLVGGPNYTVDPDEQFATLELAVNEWLRRRNDWTGRFPLWGDGLNLNPQQEVEGEAEVEGESAIVLFGDAETTEDGWSLLAALTTLHREDEFFLYVD